MPARSAILGEDGVRGTIRCSLIPTVFWAMIWHVISGLFYGGGQRIVCDLLSGARGRNVGLIVLGDYCVSELSQYPKFIVPYDGRYNSARTLWRTSSGLHKLIKTWHPAIVHSHGLDADLISSLCVSPSKCLHVSHLHVTPSIGSSSRKAWLRRELFRYLTRRANSNFVAVSESVRHAMIEFYGIPEGRVRTIYNGIDTEHFAKLERKHGAGLVIGSAGRLAPGKGFRDLIEAVAKLKREGVCVSLQIAGVGSDEGALSEYIRDLGMEQSVTLVGHVGDMPAFYRALDVFVLPSLSEGFPLVVLEAMATGLPVVATDVGGTKEALRDSIDGWVVPPKDPGALAEALKRFIVAPSLLNEMGNSGANRVRDQFSTERMVNEIEGYYDELLTGRSGGL